jgi:hypothetical protein
MTFSQPINPPVDACLRINDKVTRVKVVRVIHKDQAVYNEVVLPDQSVRTVLSDKLIFTDQPDQEGEGVQTWEVPIVYRGQCSYIVKSKTAKEAEDIAKARFNDGVEPDDLGNGWEEIEKIGTVTTILLLELSPLSTTHEEMLDASDSELWYCQSCEYDGTATEFSPTDGRPDVPTCPKCESTNCFTKD